MARTRSAKKLGTATRERSLSRLEREIAMEKVYSIAEIFPTIQGEGLWSGTPALFIRLAGCNLWSGRVEDRERDSKRSQAKCPMFCDTDFSPKEKLSAADLVSRVADYSDKGGRLVVITGGEPLLQLDYALVSSLLEIAGVSVETNGTVALSEDLFRLTTDEESENRLWITCSPKKSAGELAIDPKSVGELKVVYPDYDPLQYLDWVDPKTLLYIQPSAPQCGLGVSVLDKVNMANAARWCMEHPEWSLSLQTHKILSLP